MNYQIAFLKTLPYIIPGVVSLALALILTPIVREINRRLGMVDRPGARRINQVPIPRGGGIAIVIAVAWFYFDIMPRMATLAVAIAVIGYVDDRYNLSPRVKLAGQLIGAFLAWWWGGVGFAKLWPALPMWADCLMTMFWITGAVNAFNLIDGLDGLASGIALIATIGMAGSLFLVRHYEMTPLHFALAGALIGFLRYNYHPASVFLGDSGSMFIGFVIATLPLAALNPNSMLVSVGVPLLAMGVPIFDTALAIIRRSIRHLIRQRDKTESGNDKVMAADSDHLHHRILRSVGLSQRKAAWSLYAVAAVGVLFGLVGTALESRAAGLWIFAVGLAGVVIFKDMARIELFDAGRLLGSMAHHSPRSSRRRWARLTIPFYLIFDIFALLAAFLFCCWVIGIPCDQSVAQRMLPVKVISVFCVMVFMQCYRTIWARAMCVNYAKLAFACAFGAMIGSAIAFYVPSITTYRFKIFTVLYAFTSFGAVSAVRIVRSLVRNLFYWLDCKRLAGRKDVSRVLVYGSGLRYRAFLRELVRSASRNDRIIVGLIDDDILLRGHWIGSTRVEGTLSQAPEIINRLNVDAVVVACEITPEWRRVILNILKPTGVKITFFTFSETDF